MNFQDAIRSSLSMSEFLVSRYIDDLKPEEMLVRPATDANHIAWQLGHLIQSERYLVEAVSPGSMPPLPAGFAERHTKDTAASDNPSDFLSKEEYLKTAKDVRAGTLKVLETLSDEDMDKAPAGRVPPMIKKAGECLVPIGPHSAPAMPGSGSSRGGNWAARGSFSENSTS